MRYLIATIFTAFSISIFAGCNEHVNDDQADDCSDGTVPFEVTERVDNGGEMIDKKSIVCASPSSPPTGGVRVGTQ